MSMLAMNLDLTLKLSVGDEVTVELAVEASATMSAVVAAQPCSVDDLKPTVDRDAVSTKHLSYPQAADRHLSRRRPGSGGKALDVTKNRL